MNVKHEKSIILDIVKHRLYDDGKHDSSFFGYVRTISDCSML